MTILMINFACGHEEDKLLTGDPVTRATTLIKDVSRSILNNHLRDRPLGSGNKSHRRTAHKERLAKGNASRL